MTRYDPYDDFRCTPPDGTNPSISDLGYTGHHSNNSGTNDIGIIYMGARYYLPEVYRFVTADTIVPDPGKVLFSQPVSERGRETEVPRTTVSDKAKRFVTEGMLGLIDALSLAVKMMNKL